MNFQSISLQDRDFLMPFLQGDSRKVGDSVFSNMYMWRHSRNIAFCELDSCLIIETTYAGQQPFIFYPFAKNPKSCNMKEIILKLKDYYEAKNSTLEFRCLEKSQVDMLDSMFPNAFEFTQRRDKFDYIYSIEELVNLSGRKFHKKKNHLNRFYLEYPNAVYESICESNIAEIKKINNEWFGALPKDEIDIGLKFENLGINDALDSFDVLNLKGGCIKINNEIIAFSFGEIYLPNYALIHIEKANIAYKGAYQAINNALLKNEFSNLEFANREEDLGIEGLRKAKLSYNPLMLLEKYDARLKSCI